MRKFALVGAIVLLMGLSALPASATHGADCVAQDNCITVVTYEGGGAVCDAADNGGGASIWSALKPVNVSATNCSYYNDALWSGPTSGVAQGLYAPRLGPPASRGGSTFSAGGLNPPTSYCVDSIGGPGCLIESATWLTPGVPTGLGAYCGSSKGIGKSKFSRTSPSMYTISSYGWTQSAATILPITGSVIQSNPSGAAGATLISFVSSRGGAGSVGSCGISGPNDPTSVFRVEGMAITF